MDLWAYGLMDFWYGVMYELRASLIMILSSTGQLSRLGPS
jgi:hypothetical protein